MKKNNNVGNNDDLNSFHKQEEQRLLEEEYEKQKQISHSLGTLYDLSNIDFELDFDSAFNPEDTEINEEESPFTFDTDPYHYISTNKKAEVKKRFIERILLMISKIEKK